MANADWIRSGVLLPLFTPTTVYRLAAWRSSRAATGRLVVVGHGPGCAHLRYRSTRDEDRNACERRQAWLLEAAARSGGARPTVREGACLSRGETTCEYTVFWGGRARIVPAVVAGFVALAGVAGTSRVTALPPAAWLLVPLAMATAYGISRWRAARGDRVAETESVAALRWLVARALASRADCATGAERRAPDLAAPALAPGSREAGSLTLEREGEFWRVGYAGTRILVRHSRGVALLAHLVRSPGVEIHVRELDAITPSGGSPVPKDGPAPDGGMRRAIGDAGEILDARARAEYRDRLVELRAELADAERSADLGQAANARAEIDVLAEQLRTAVGTGGRGRRASADVERLRVAITRRIRDAIAMLAKNSPALGAHLAAHIATGYFCSYDPGAMVGAMSRVPRDP